MSKFIEQLSFLRDSKLNKIELENAGAELMQLFLDTCSETDDNRNCVNFVELGNITHSAIRSNTQGLKIKGKEILVSDILNCLESEDKPPLAVSEAYPNLTDLEWQAALRVTTVILLELEKHEHDVEAVG